MRFASVSLAMTMPGGIEDELTSSSACSASRSCAVWNRVLVIHSRAKGSKISHLGARGSAHVNYLLELSLVNSRVLGECDNLPCGGVLPGGTEAEAC